MAASTESTLLYIHGNPLDEAARAALVASAEALGHVDGCSFAAPEELMAYGGVELAIRELDPWAAVAVDDTGIQMLREAFGERSAALEPDNPQVVDGYTLVAVPDFAFCLDDLPAKRIAWGRLKAAKHPGNPLS